MYHYLEHSNCGLIKPLQLKLWDGRTIHGKKREGNTITYSSVARLTKGTNVLEIFDREMARHCIIFATLFISNMIKINDQSPSYMY